MSVPALRKDENFRVIDVRNILNKDQSLTAYSQLVNLGNQVVPVDERTQIVDNSEGAETFTSKTLWNPITNRISLIDAKVGDYVDIDIVLTSSGTSGTIYQISTQLDYSSNLDGSLVVTKPVARFAVFSGAVGPIAVHFSFKFVINETMKENGIAIMVSPYTTYTLQSTRLMIERFVAPT